MAKVGGQTYLDGSEEEGVSHNGYSKFLKQRIANYTRRKNHWEDVDSLVECKTDANGKVNLYCKDGDQADLPYQLTDPRLGKRNRSSEETQESLLGEACTRSGSGLSSPPSSWIKVIHDKVDRLLAEVKPPLFAKSK